MPYAYDIIGTQLSGASEDLDALLAGGYPMVLAGADQSLAMAAPAAQQMVNNLALRGGGAAVVSRSATKARKYMQGFGPVTIAAGATANIIVQPQVTFKGKRLFIPSDFAGAILVNDLKVGNVSQFPSSNGVPGRVFTEFAVGADQDFDTAQISQQISLSVTNTSGAPIVFTASLNGIIVA